MEHGETNRSQGIGRSREKNKITFSFVGKLLEVRIPEGNPALEPLDSPPVGPSREMPRWIFDVIDGFRIATALIVENGIAETNATYVNRNSIVLLDIALTPLLNSLDFPGILEKIRQSKNLEDLKSVFGELAGIKIETQPVVTVRLS